MRTSLKCLIKIIAISSSSETKEKLLGVIPLSMHELINELLNQPKSPTPQPQQYLESDDFSSRSPQPQQCVNWSTDSDDSNDAKKKK